ncbi:hypothetical protein GJ496_007750 [Pomphorhynchus laevis]|nr:hypothetical protein GJ496_007750 [Pomphorhynchus laevis]
MPTVESHTAVNKDDSTPSASDIAIALKISKSGHRLSTNSNSIEELKYRQNAETIKDEIKQVQKKFKDRSFKQAVAEVPKIQNPLNFKTRRLLRGHLTKVLQIKWIGQSNDLLSISPDGQVLFWDTVTGMKTMLKQLPTQWSTCVATSPDRRLLATGGLDNLCIVRSLKNMLQSITLEGHNAYISQCYFLSNGERILTSSGDHKIILWDITTAKPIHTFLGHHAEVLNICMSKDELSLLSVSMDKTCRIWDIRGRSCTRLCEGHSKGVNCAAFFPNDQAFVSGSDDQSCMLYDIRAGQYISSYIREKVIEDAGITSVAFSKSGRLLIVGYEDSKCVVWDTIKPSVILTNLAHPNKVSAVSVNYNGDALATSCWDCNIRIWN